MQVWGVQLRWKGSKKLQIFTYRSIFHPSSLWESGCEDNQSACGSGLVYTNSAPTWTRIYNLMHKHGQTKICTLYAQRCTNAWKKGSLDFYKMTKSCKMCQELKGYWTVESCSNRLKKKTFVWIFKVINGSQTKTYLIKTLNQLKLKQLSRETTRLWTLINNKKLLLRQHRFCWHVLHSSFISLDG